MLDREERLMEYHREECYYEKNYAGKEIDEIGKIAKDMFLFPFYIVLFIVAITYNIFKFIFKRLFRF